MGYTDPELPEPPGRHERRQLVRLPQHHKSKLLLQTPPRKESLPGRNDCTAGEPCTAQTFTTSGTGKQRPAAGAGYFHKRILHP